MAFVPVLVKRRLLTKANFGGGVLFNLLAFAVQPVAYLKRNAMRRGVLGPSLAWRVVAVAVYSPGAAKKIFGKEVEVISTEKVGKDSFANVITVPPMSKKQQRATGITKKVLEAQAASDVAQSWAVKVAAKPSRKNRRRAAKTDTMAVAARAKADKAQRKSRKRAS